MENIINLDQGVIRALEFFSKNKLPKLNLNKFDFPIVVGSGNAYNTGQILFSGRKAIIADESTFRKVIENYKGLINKKIIKEVIVISASGEKDSVWELELAKKNKLKTILLTCSPDSSASKIADQIIIYPKISEPYTYNISTYLGMVLSATGENPKNILNFIKKLKLKAGFKNYNSYAFVLPDDFIAITPMLDIKKSELFGPKLSLRAFSFGHARHAKFVIRDKKELVITLGKEKNLYFGDPQSRWQINLPQRVDFAFILCLTYYLVGKIQISKPSYFKNNIKEYCQKYGPQAYGSKGSFDLVVPGN
ncbi:MAG: SIS domain-containing protein [Patescibacteria group bacterium]|nr:SIS domain-containing protein [Patescibacteria group bacterium]